MVSSTHWLASAVGMAVLDSGGNAFDAAVAMGFLLQVVEPHLYGLGGEIPIVFFEAKSGRVHVLNGQGPAPAAASSKRFAELDLKVIPGTGYLPACVPGAFGALLVLLRDYGTLSFRDVIAYAIRYADNGHPMTSNVCDVISIVEPLFRSEWRESAAVYLADGTPKPGRLFHNRALGRTYRRLLEAAEEAAGSREFQIDRALSAFYDGFVAEAIDNQLRKAEAFDVSGRRNRALLTGQDLHGWRPRLEDALAFDYGGFRVFKAGPWSQGPVFLQQLALLREFDLQSMGSLSADAIHTIVECSKLALADRDAWYGDPAFVEVPMDALLSDGYSQARMRLIAHDASLELRPGSPNGQAPRFPVDYAIDLEPSLDSDFSFVSTGVRADPPNGTESRNADPDIVGRQPTTPLGVTPGDTCQLDVIDRWGNLVAATPSGGLLQGSPAIQELGFPLGTRMQMFYLEDGLPNTLQPGKLPRTTLSPTLALGDGKSMAFGTRGGDKQDQWSLTFFLGVADFGLNFQEAIDAPNFHTVHCPDSFYPHASRPGRILVESRLDPAVIEQLTKRGHDIQVEGPWSLGQISAVGADGDVLRAGANPRGMQSYAIGR